MMPEEAAEQTRVFMSTASSAVWGNEARDVQGVTSDERLSMYCI